MAYNPNFQWKRKTVTITAGTALPTNYQVKLTIPKETEMQPDFRDLRFETTDGYGLPHWLESINTTPNPDEATVWIKLKDTVNASTTVDIYMYYGNPYVPSVSNGTNTFLDFEDFTSISDWTVESGPTFVSDATTWGNGIYSGKFTGAVNWNEAYRSITAKTTDFIAEFEIRIPTGVTHWKFWVLEKVGGDYNNGINVAYDTSTGYLSLYDGTIATNLQAISVDINYKIRLVWHQSTDTADAYVNGVQKATGIDCRGLSSSINAISIFGYQTTSSWIAQFRTRKYVATEPGTPAISQTSTTVNWNPQRKKITINTTTATPANYQIKLTIPFAQEMNIDFSDLRFVTKTSPSVSLDYWIESSTPGITTDIWVELTDAINASSSDYIYMHYGNSNLTSLSNGPNTFLQWHGYANSNFQDATIVSIPFVYEVKAKRTSNSPGQIYFGTSSVQNSATGTGDAISIVPSATDNIIYSSSRNSGAASTPTSSPLWTLDTFYRVKFVAISSSLIDYYVQDRTTYTNSVTATAAIPDIQMGLNYYIYSGTGEQEFSFIRKYITTEPTADSITGPVETVNTFFNRKKLTINNNSGGPLTDYQIPVTVSYMPSMQANFNDIRFVDSSGNLLSCWLESSTPSSTALFWIKVNLPNYGITPTGDNTAYMYYGNKNAASASNVTNTFIREIPGVMLAYDFKNNLNDTSGSNNYGVIAGGSPSYSSVKFGQGMSFNGTTDYVLSNSNLGITGNSDRTIFAWAKFDVSTGERGLISFGREPTCAGGANQAYIISINTTAGTGWYLAGTAADWNVGVAADTNLNCHIIEHSSGISSWYLNNSSIGTPFSHTFDTINSVVSLARISCGTTYSDINIAQVHIYNRALTYDERTDLYNNYGYTTTNYTGKTLVRKYASPEPTITAGTEERVHKGGIIIF